VILVDGSPASLVLLRKRLSKKLRGLFRNEDVRESLHNVVFLRLFTLRFLALLGEELFRDLAREIEDRKYSSSTKLFQQRPYIKTRSIIMVNNREY
jgi:hypothetical protein